MGQVRRKGASRSSSTSAFKTGACRRLQGKWCSRPVTIGTCWRRFTNEGSASAGTIPIIVALFCVSWLCRWGGGTMPPCRVPITDFVHFTDRSKPWFLSRSPDDYYWRRSNNNNNNGRSIKATAAGYWYQELDRLNQGRQLGLDMDDFSNGRGKSRLPLLDLFPLHVSAPKANYSSVFVDALAAATAAAAAS
jgi:hypothetical protein